MSYTKLSINTAAGVISHTLPAGSNESDYVATIVKAGGIWSPQGEGQPNQPASSTFIPMSQIFSITAQ